MIKPHLLTIAALAGALISGLPASALAQVATSETTSQTICDSRGLNCRTVTSTTQQQPPQEPFSRGGPGTTERIDVDKDEEARKLRRQQVRRVPDAPSVLCPLPHYRMTVMDGCQVARR